MKKWIRIVLLPVIIMVVLLLIFYLSMAAYYKNRFSFGTIINGYYSAGLTVEEVNRNLLVNSEQQILCIEHIDGEDEILLSDLSVTMDYSSKLQQKLNSQNSLLWGVGLFFPIKEKVTPDIIFDESVVEHRIKAYDFMKRHIYKEDNGLSIVKDSSLGYVLIDETHDLLDVEYATRVIIETLHQSNFSVSLVGNNCYRSLQENAEMRQIRQQYAAICEFQDFHMTYSINEQQELVDAGVVADWIALDEEGNIMFDEEGAPVLDKGKVEAYVRELSVRHNNQINVYNEYIFLLDAFQNKESGEREIVLP